VTLSQPVKVCSSSGTRWVWSHASFTFPNGLPAALRGQNARQNPWTFSGLITAAAELQLANISLLSLTAARPSPAGPPGFGSMGQRAGKNWSNGPSTR